MRKISNNFAISKMAKSGVILFSFIIIVSNLVIESEITSFARNLNKMTNSATKLRDYKNKNTSTNYHISITPDSKILSATKRYRVIYKESSNKQSSITHNFVESSQFISTLNDFQVEIINLSEKQLQELKSNPQIQEVIEDKIVKMAANISEYTENWGTMYTRVPLMHEQGFKGKGKRIAILDSGIDLSNQEITKNYTDGYDYVRNDSLPNDESGHGTSVASIIASQVDNKFAAGIAPDAEIFVYKVLDHSGNGMWGDITRAIDRAISKEVDIINISLGTEFYPGSDVERAIKRANAAGIIVVAAAGNLGTQHGLENRIIYPAKFSETIAIGSISKDAQRSEFSSVGEELDFLAPGEGVMAHGIENKFISVSGTSFAAPHVTGMLALMKNDTELSGTQVTEFAIDELKKLSRDQGTSQADVRSGYGEVRFKGTNKTAEFTIQSPRYPVIGTNEVVEFKLITPHLNHIKKVTWDSSISDILGEELTLSTSLEKGKHLIRLYVEDINDFVTDRSVEIEVYDQLILGVNNPTISPLGKDSFILTGKIIDQTSTPKADAIISVEIINKNTVLARKSAKSQKNGYFSLMFNSAGNKCVFVKIITVKIGAYNLRNPLILGTCQS